MHSDICEHFELQVAGVTVNKRLVLSKAVENLSGVPWAESPEAVSSYVIVLSLGGKLDARSMLVLTVVVGTSLSPRDDRPKQRLFLLCHIKIPSQLGRLLHISMQSPDVTSSTACSLIWLST